MASSPPSPSLLAPWRGGDDATVTFRIPAGAQAAELTGYCPFVQPSLQASALQYGSSSADAVWDTFRDLMITTQQFQGFHDGLPQRARGLACLVLSFERETPTAKLNQLFSCVRVLAAEQAITMGLIPAGSAVKTGDRLRTSNTMPTIVVFRTALARDSKFRTSPRFQEAAEALKRAAPTELLDADQWPSQTDRTGWLTSLNKLTSALKGQL
ncbi:hypothetical protein [Microbacterium gorillae]|uniref:hypothetical protein n=1 Tax=Microbacterium gorillae TaxID=1231063 RepID=UPI003D95F2C5